MKDENIKLNLYRLKSIIIQNKYNKSLKKQTKNYNIKNLLITYIKNLKKINCIYTRADKEALLYGGTSYQDTLTYDEILNRNCFFALILGFIDANLDYTNSNYINKVLYDFRIQVLSDYKESFTSCETKLLLDTAKEIPSYLNLINLFIKINNKYDSIKLNFLSNYTLGYSSYNKNSVLEIYYLYLDLLKDFNEYKKKNEETINKLRLKKLNY